MGSLVVLFLRTAEKDALGANPIDVKDADSKALAYGVLFDGRYSFLLAAKGPGRY